MNKLSNSSQNNNHNILFSQDEQVIYNELEGILQPIALEVVFSLMSLIPVVGFFSTLGRSIISNPRIKTRVDNISKICNQESVQITPDNSLEMYKLFSKYIESPSEVPPDVLQNTIRNLNENFNEELIHEFLNSNFDQIPQIYEIIKKVREENFVLQLDTSLSNLQILTDLENRGYVVQFGEYTIMNGFHQLNNYKNMKLTSRGVKFFATFFSPNLSKYIPHYDIFDFMSYLGHSHILKDPNNKRALFWYDKTMLLKRVDAEQVFIDAINNVEGLKLHYDNYCLEMRIKINI